MPRLGRSDAAWLTFAGFCAIGGITWCDLALLDGCADPPVVVNPASAQCLLDRDRAQNDCVSSDAGFDTRQACLEHVRQTKDCTKDGGK